jgi:hypothetical protein
VGLKNRQDAGVVTESAQEVDLANEPSIRLGLGLRRPDDLEGNLLLAVATGTPHRGVSAAAKLLCTYPRADGVLIAGHTLQGTARAGRTDPKTRTLAPPFRGAVSAVASYAAQRRREGLAAP